MSSQGLFYSMVSPGREIALREIDPHITELAMVVTGMKPVLYTNFSDSDWGYIRDVCTTFDLKFLIPAEIPVASPGARKTVLIGKDEDVLRRAADSWNRGVRSMEWGLYLGYPKCCVEAYARRTKRRFPYVLAREELVRRIHGATERNDEPCSFLLNNVFNYFSRIFSSWLSPREDQDKHQGICAANQGLSISALHVIPWHPCSYRCPESLKRGGGLYDFLRQHVPGFAAKLTQYLRRPILFFDKYEFAVLNGLGREGGWVRYDGLVPLRSLLSQRSAEELRAGCKLRITGGEIRILKRSGREAGIKARKAILLDFTA